MLNAGENTIGNMRFDIIEVGNAYNIAIPAINGIYTHMLGADTHSILAGQEQINALLTSLENIEATDYQLILSSHHTPETLADVTTKIAYIKKVQAFVAQSKSREEFLTLVKNEFPSYLGLNYLEMTANYLFPNN